MKKIVSFDQEIGGDGAKASGQLAVNGESLIAQVEVSYPLEKVLEPATKAVDSAIDKLKKAIPGSWDDALLEKVKTEYKAELLKLLGSKA